MEVTHRDGSASESCLWAVSCHQLILLTAPGLPLQDVHTAGVGAVPMECAGGDWCPQTRHAGPLCSSQCQSRVRAVEMHNGAWSEALPGDGVGFSIKHMSFRDVHRGSVTGDSGNDSPMETAGFTAQGLSLSHPGLIGASLSRGFHGSQFGPARGDCHSGKKLENSPKFLKYGDAAITDVVPGRPRVLRATLTALLWAVAVHAMRWTGAVGAIKVVEGQPELQDHRVHPESSGAGSRLSPSAAAPSQPVVEERFRSRWSQLAI